MCKVCARAVRACLDMCSLSQGVSIIRAFLIEEQKIVKKVLQEKMKKKK